MGQDPGRKKAWSRPECEPLGVQRASPSHPLLALALGCQMGRACLESPQVLGYMVHGEEGKRSQMPMSEVYIGRGREGCGGIGLPAKTEDSYGAYTCLAR